MNQTLKLERYINLFVPLTVACLLSGCAGFYPHTSDRSRELRGRVLDAKTHQPIKGAKVYFCDPPHHTTYTDADGYFLMKAAKNFHWFAGADGSGYPNAKSDRICISQKKYVTRSYQRFSKTDPLNILLEPNQ